MTSAPAASLASTAPKQLVPALVRFAAAVAVSMALTVVWVTAESDTHRAVQVLDTLTSGSSVNSTLGT